MTEHPIGRAGHRMGTHKENSITPLLKRCDIACPGIAKDILRTDFQPVGEKALKTIGTARAMAINHLDHACTGCTGTTHGCIHLIGIELPALFVQCFTCRNLVPMLYTGNTFHITENNNVHTLLLEKYSGKLASLPGTRQLPLMQPVKLCLLPRTQFVFSIQTFADFPAQIAA